MRVACGSESWIGNQHCADLVMIISGLPSHIHPTGDPYPSWREDFRPKRQLGLAQANREPRLPAMMCVISKLPHLPPT